MDLKKIEEDLEQAKTHNLPYLFIQRDIAGEWLSLTRKQEQALADSNLALMEQTEIAQAANRQEEDARAELEEWRFTNKIDELQREVDRYRAAPQQHAQAVHQFRKAGAADWYDGHPDNEDGGGPYEVRTLYTGPQQHAQAALSDEQIDALWGKTNDRDPVVGLPAHIRFARAILATRHAAPVVSAPAVAVPEGWKLVPRELTEDQSREIVYNINRKYKGNPMSDFLAREVWKLGMYAAPQPAAAPVAAEVAQGDPVREALQMLYDDQDVIEVITTKQAAQVAHALAAQPPADAAPVDAKPIGKVCYGAIPGGGWHVYADWNGVAPPVGAVLYVAQPSTAQGDALSQSKFGRHPGWEYCPECGCLETDPPQEGMGYSCANCGQEWHDDIDYSGVVRANLERLTQRAASQPDSERDAARYRYLRNPDPQPERDLDVHTLTMKIIEGSDLDAAIDAAMAAQQGEKG